MNATAAIRFGRIEIDAPARRLRVDGAVVPLGGRAFDVLLALVERRDSVVTKDELLSLAWPGLVVEENNLQVQISTLRRALGPTAIVTVAGRGYRLALEPDRDALEALPPRSNNLPAPVASFIGREKELAEVASLAERHRLLTLVGVGGIGKTRLAIESASRMSVRFSAGVCFVDLAPLSDARLVADAVAAAMGIAQPLGTSALDVVRQHVASLEQLVVLDNCEHLLDACAQIAKGILASGSRVRILATSREPLHVAGEATFGVPALAVPDSHERTSLEAMEQSAAVQVFVARASAARPGFALAADNAVTIAQICREVDGIPLAIELAAARVRSVSLTAIAQRLADRFRILKGNDPTALPRHQTLRGTLDWSHDLLSEVERSLLRRVSVFAGGFTLDAAESLGGDLASHDEEVLDLLGHLVDKSLVTLDPRGERYRLFETVRQYAMDRLAESGESDAAHAAHLAYYVELAERAGPYLLGPEEEGWRCRLDPERENVMQATTRALAAQDGVEGVLAILYWLRPWLARVYTEQWHRIAVEALASPVGLAPTLARARALYATAFLSYLMGRYEESCVSCEESLSIALRQGDEHATGEAHCQLGASLLAIDPERAFAHFESGLAIGQKLGNTDLKIFGYAGLGESLAIREQWEPAEASYVQSLEIGRRLGSSYHVALALGNIARCQIMLGKRASAVALLREALTHMGTPWTQLTLCVLELCAGLAVLEGDVPLGARFWSATDACCARNGLHWEPVEAPVIARMVAAIEAHPDRRVIEAAIAEGRALDDASALALAREWLATRPP